ncbi:hypothetical protein V513_08125 [Mesotoga sp. H07.pep.5.3]|nr:hypothetical protein V513_08125 [Mesotoga sp. H07.pep.5.3]
MVGLYTITQKIMCKLCRLRQEVRKKRCKRQEGRGSKSDKIVRGLDEQDARRENRGQASGARQSPFSPERDALRELYGITAREYREMIQHFSGQTLFLQVILTMLLVRTPVPRENGTAFFTKEREEEREEE